MELEDLKSQWRELDRRMAGADAKIERLTAHLTAGKCTTSLQRLKRMHRLALAILALLPFCYIRMGGASFGLATHALLIVFIGAMAIMQVVLLTLLGKIDVATQSTAEVCAAVIRYRKGYLAGVMAGVTLAAALFVFLGIAVKNQASPYVLYGLGAGLIVGLPLGTRIFLRAMEQIAALQASLRDAMK